MDDRLFAIPLAVSLIKPAAGVLARAFHDDPFFVYALPDADRRFEVLLWFYERFVGYGLRYGSIYTTPSLEGIAMWFGPHKTDLDWNGVLRSGLFLLPIRLSRQEFKRTMEMQSAADHLHAKWITGAHWYLSELAVDPSRQHQGVGRALIQPVLAMADRSKLPCYLETNKEQNLSFYEKNGFKVTEYAQANPKSPITWGMLRKPR